MHRAFTLVELVAVAVILAVVALLALPRYSNLPERLRKVAAERDLETIADAFSRPDGGYLADFTGMPGFTPVNLRIANLLVATNLYGFRRGAGGRREYVRVDETWAGAGVAQPSAFRRYDETAHRGWRGPYARGAAERAFPSPGDRRGEGDGSFYERGFFPPCDGLDLPAEITLARGGASAYGFPGEVTLFDPWGNPYVLQVPPPQAFGVSTTNEIPDSLRWRFARIVSAGANGILETPCHARNLTNRWNTTWSDSTRRLSRQAGRDGTGAAARGDDLVRFLYRADVDCDLQP